MLQVVWVALTCFFLVLLTLWCWVKWRHRDLIRAASNMPSVLPTLPILGNLHYALLGAEELTRRFLYKAQLLSSLGVYSSCFWLGPFPIVYICGVEDIQKVSTSMKYPIRGFEMDIVRFVLGNGLLTAPGHVWKVTRRAIEPVFHPRNLRQLVPTFNRNSRELMVTLSQYEGQGSFDIFSVVINTSLQTICHLLFGPEVEFDIKSEEFENLVSLLKSVPTLAYKRVISVWLQPDFIFNFVYKSKMDEINAQWDKFSTEPLKVSRRINLEKELQNQNNDNNSDKAGREGPENLINVYSNLQKTHAEITDNDLKSELITMYFAGSDTIAYSVSGCLLLLAQHKDVQERLYEEISSVMDPDSDVTAEDLLKMPYLDQVFKETLRWSKILPFASRRATEDLELSTCTLKKGCTFLLAVIGPFMDPKIYPNPTKFNPDHFSPENTKGRDRYAFQPFAAGPRGCIGKLYSDYLFKIIVTHILRKYEVSTSMDVDNLRRKMTIFLSSTEGYRISLQRRSP